MTTGSMTQGEWMARNLERMASTLRRVSTGLEEVTTTEQKERLVLLLDGVILELSIAEEFSGLPSGSKQIYEAIRTLLGTASDRLKNPIDISELGQVAEIIVIESTRLGLDMTRAERDRGSKINLDPDTAQMTLFEAFQT